MEFNYLVFANVGNASIHNARAKRTPLSPSISCHAVVIAWGNWYNERPFNGMRDLRFLTYGGLQIAHMKFENDDKAIPEVPIFIRQNKVENFKFSTGKKVLLTDAFQFEEKTHWCDLFVGNIRIQVSRADQDQPMKLINWKGYQCFGGEEESWIAPYEKHPNRPFLEWRLNPNRTS